MTDPIEVSDLRTLKAELLRHEIRSESAEADIRQIELAIKRDQERDRMVMGGHARRLDINAVITSPKLDAWIDALEHWEHRDPGQPITITIDSPGGSVMGGFAVFDTIMRLRRKEHKVTTRGRGMVASMAAVILQAGDDRVFDANAQLLIHEISFNTEGKMSEVEDGAAFAKRLQKRLLDILAERSNMTHAQIARKWKKTDWWLDSEQALELGFIDRIE